MLTANYLHKIFQENGINFFTGVPDSLLKHFCSYIYDNLDDKNHIIAANEGNAISIAAGYHLATNKIGVVYMQNSGLGNCVNPLTSLTDKEVYSIPILLLIGWRGEPGVKDEPQHLQMGEKTLDILKVLEIPYSILPDDEEETAKVVKNAVEHMRTKNSPYAIVVRKGSFEKYSVQKEETTNHILNREKTIQTIASSLDENDIVVSTTGKTSRELFEHRANNGQGHHRDFLTVGSMGHSSSIALGIALQKPGRNVYCFDGDGALIMHMGSLSTVGKLQPNNFKHIIFNNLAHESVGGQPTAADSISIVDIAKANGYTLAFSAKTEEELMEKIEKLKTSKGPALLEVKIRTGSRSDLGRPTKTPLENKQDFMRFISPSNQYSSF